jgi:hypothetical protein
MKSILLAIALIGAGLLLACSNGPTAVKDPSPTPTSTRLSPTAAPEPTPTPSHGCSDSCTP